MVLFTQIEKKYLMLVIILIAPLFLSFGQTVDAYGFTNHENVVDVGKNHFVILKEDGSVWSWGDHSYGQLGAKATTSTSNPLPIQNDQGNRLSDIIAISAGGNHTVALDSKGRVFTWGSNEFGQLGNHIMDLKNESPTVVPIPPKIIAISAGDNHTLAVDEFGEVWTWGYNGYGQLGRATMDAMTGIPGKATQLNEIVAVAAGKEHSTALSRNGTVFTWGRNTYGQLGNGGTADENIKPEIVPGLTDIMEIAAGDNHTLALKQDHTTIWAWGRNITGQLGDGGFENKLRPIQVQGISKIKTIAAGDNHSIVIKEDDKVWTWGRNTSGLQSSRTTPIEIKGLEDAVAIGGGGFSDSYILAVKSDGTVWQWDKASSDSTTKLPIFKKKSGIDDVMKLDDFPFVQGGQVLFRYIGNYSTTDVQVTGSFNENIDLPLEYKGSNVWELQVELQPGESNYGFKVNGQWTVDPLNRNKTIDNFGRPFSVLKIAPYATEGPIIDNKEVTFTYSSYDINELLELEAKTKSVSVMGNFGDDYHWIEIPLVKQPNNTWKITRDLEPRDYYYSFIVLDNTSGKKGVGEESEKRNDPLNAGLQMDAMTGISRNIFVVSEKVLTKIPVSNIALNKGPDLDLVVGEQEDLIARISPSNATNKNVVWSSSKPEIVSVEDGKITAHSKGSATIIVAAADQGGKTANVTVTVTQQDNAVSYPRVGYKKYDDKMNVSVTKPWYIKFKGEEVDLKSVNFDNVYVLNESDIKMPLGYKLQSDGKTLEIRLLDGSKYERGATYYLFVEDSVTSKLGTTLPEKYQMMFQIEL